MHIEYPHPDFKIKNEDDKEFIFDAIRKKWVRLTPEEWVRQNFLQYLIKTKKYPASLIAVEKEIELGDLKKRCDMVVYRNARPWMIVECKEMNIPLNEALLQQVLRYNISLDVNYLVVTNGVQTYGLKTFAGKTIQLIKLPDWDDNEA